VCLTRRSPNRAVLLTMSRQSEPFMPMRRFVSSGACLTSLLLFSVSIRVSAASGPATDLPGAASAPTTSLSEVARGLESPLFAVREAATQRLVDAQAPAVPLLLKVAKDESLEAAVRAVGILEDIYAAGDAKGDVSAIDGAETALDELTRSGRPSVSDRAEFVLESHYDIRERRAVAEIEQLHGRAVFGDLAAGPNVWNGRRHPAPAALDRSGDPSKDKAELSCLIIGPKWTGADDGLKYVARLKRLRLLYRIQGSPVSDEGIAKLRAALPGVDVQVRGAAKLGITNGGAGIGEQVGCLIHDIQEGEAAANAGLRPQDRIVEFGTHRVDDFYSLIELLRSYKPGETVDCIIERDQIKKKIPVTLTGWD
jgi:hypothetical protein